MFVLPDLHVRVPRSGGPRDRDLAVLERADEATLEKRFYSGLHQYSNPGRTILQHEVRKHLLKQKKVIFEKLETELINKGPFK